MSAFVMHMTIRKEGVMLVLTYDTVHSTLFPQNQPKLFGRVKPSLKLKEDPLNSIRLRKATTTSIRASVNLSTMSM